MSDELIQCPPEPRMLGYARVSTDDQDLALQIDALTKHGIPKPHIFMDKLSGAKTERPGLAIDPQVVNAISSKVQRMWLAPSRLAKKQATAESGINKLRLYQSESQ